MVRESGISATKPIFPSYLLPTISLPFRRRSSSSSTFSAISPTSTAFTTPDNSPPTSSRFATRRLSRTAPDTLRCMHCSSDVAFTSQIISKGFTGRHGRALLVAPAPDTDSLVNVRVGRVESRQLVTGWHVVADITCGTCRSKLGWKYVDAKEASQKYKVNKYILETMRVMTFRNWEDVDVEILDEREQAELSGLEEHNEEGDEDSVVFDSEDEDECEDIFAGTWNRDDVRARRASMPAKKLVEEPEGQD